MIPVLLLAAFLLNERGLFVREHVEHFEVPGRSYRNFYANIEDYGPGGRFSWFQYQAGLFYYLEPSEEDQCWLSDAEITLDLTFKLPQWSRYERGNAREKAAFDRIYGAERAFLEGYADLARGRMNAALRQMHAVPATACGQLEQQLETVFRDHLAELDEAIAAHGETAGTHDRADTSCARRGSRVRNC